jgi:hypothetical protein
MYLWLNNIFNLQLIGTQPLHKSRNLYIVKKSLFFLTPSQSHPPLNINHCRNGVSTICCREKIALVREVESQTFFFCPQVLKFLAKRRKTKKLFASWYGLQEFTDARRVELKQQVDDYVKRHPVCRLLCIMLYYYVTLFHFILCHCMVIHQQSSVSYVYAHLLSAHGNSVAFP